MPAIIVSEALLLDGDVMFRTCTYRFKFFLRGFKEASFGAMEKKAALKHAKSFFY